MQSRKIKILGMGKYLPKKEVTSRELEARLGLAAGWIEQNLGVAVRYNVEAGETSSMMGAKAATAALQDAGLTLAEIDCIVCASGVGEQEIPCTAALIQQELGGATSGIPCFDLDATCLSFLAALDLLSYLIDAGRYQRVLIVSTEVTSVALNWEDKETCTLFGDGAAAFIIGKTPAEESSALVASLMRTYSIGAHYTEVRGGGSKIHPREYSEATKGDFLFYMDGQKVYKLAAKYLPLVVSDLLTTAELNLEMLQMIIPHQASLTAMQLVQKKLDIPAEKFMKIIQNHGNTVAASLPMTFYEAVRQGKVKRGDKVMLLGTSAGVSIGASILEY